MRNARCPTGQADAFAPSRRHSSPPATRGFLICQGHVVPASRPIGSGSSPTIPTTALSTRSVSSRPRASHNPSIPDKIDRRILARMRRRRRRFVQKSRKRRTEAADCFFEHPVILNPPPEPATGYRSEAATSSAWVPIDPVGRARPGVWVPRRGWSIRHRVSLAVSRWLTAGTTFTYARF